MPQIQFDLTTFIWLAGCLGLGVAYAFLLYRNQPHLSDTIRKILFALRALSVAFLSFLLFAPLIKISNKVLEKPLIILAQDNSASIGVSQASGFDNETYVKDIKELQDKLSGEYDLRTFEFGSTIKTGLNFNYDQKLTDISSLFKSINDQFGGRNIGAIIVGTDGIYNQGGNPQYDAKNIKAPVYPIALGDTIPKRDILISNINYNNIVYLDNQFQFEIDVEAYQSKGINTRLTVADRSGTVFTKVIDINSPEYRLTVPVTLLAAKKGIQKYTVSLSPVSNELSKENNSQVIFVEVIDGREKVLIIANSPNPDITALKQSIENNKNYEVKTAFINDVKPEDIQQANLFILHELPSLTNNAQSVLKLIPNKPVWFILGAQTNAAGFSQVQNTLSVSSIGSTQETLAKPNTDFYAFTLSDATRNKLQNFAPLISLYGSYSLKGPASVLLSQQIGKVLTKDPLLLFANEPQRKIGILAGEGLWRWRLEDFKDNNNHEAIDELISKSVQYLSAKEDKRKFRVFSSKTTFDENEHVLLNAELYNDAYELVNTPDVNIVIKDTNKKSFNFLFSRNTNAYSLDAGILPPGEYTYTASTKLGKSNYTANGQFIINQQQAEYRQTTANHQLLFAMAQQSTG